MDLILINSPDSFDTPVHYQDEPRIPLGLMSIAAWVEQCGYSVAIYDCYVNRYSIESICEALAEDSPQVVGINCYSTNWQTVFSLCDRIRAVFPDMVIVLGGPHPSCDPAHIFEHCASVDYLVAGQGEMAISDLLAHPRQGSAYCLTREQVASGIPIEPQGLPMGYQALPMPAYHLIDMERYLECDRQAYVASSRGCYYNCAFCCSKNVFNGCAAFRSCEQLMQEIDYLHARYGVTNFYFYDDNILRWEELAQFGQQMTTRGFTWTAQAAARDITPERISVLSQSGCKRLSIGFESGSAKLQRYIGKTVPGDIGERIRLLVSAGIAVRGYFMVGFPDETEADVIETAHLIRRLKQAGLSDVCIFATRPYPGTRLYNDCRERFGQEGLDDFIYLDDYVQESDPYVRAKLKAYNTIGTKSICPALSRKRIRSLIRGLYHVFLQEPETDARAEEILFSYDS